MEVLKAMDGLEALSSNSEGMQHVYRKMLESAPACWMSKPASAAPLEQVGKAVERGAPRQDCSTPHQQRVRESLVSAR
jgi:hypothetical protein